MVLAGRGDEGKCIGGTLGLTGGGWGVGFAGGEERQLESRGVSEDSETEGAATEAKFPSSDAAE